VYREVIFRLASLNPSMYNAALVDLQLPLLRTVGFVTPVVFSAGLGTLCGSRVSKILHCLVDNGWNRNTGTEND